ncbi:hypothetical protein [Acinetobacter nectaris]|uniref:hypothetical protein n=1 Tax=Acinetobacter nectaris TaxID=1219382 RepID=UPI001F436AA1|nr:hypothetical protein [Acinetobacter nectaris]MCF9034689.1 hypothetical protein [Acinetobacter nectaris]
MNNCAFASNGAAAIFIQDSKLKGIYIGIPSIAIDELEYHFKKKSLHKVDPADIFVSISSSEDGSFLSYSDIQVQFLKEDPALSILNADIKKPEVATTFPFIDLELLKNFKDSFCCLFKIADMNSVALIPSGTTSPIYVDFSENIHGIIMPVKHGERDYLMKVLEVHYKKRI